jgi:hypothetical protein
MRVRALRVMVMVGALGVLAACGLVACTPTYRVFVIGDSLTVGAVGQGLGVDTDSVDWTIDAVVGRTTNAGITVAKDRDLRGYDLVIVALGTNDWQDSAGVYGTRVDRMVAAIGDGPDVAWINVDAHTEKLRPAADGVNVAIARAPLRHPRLEVADWHEHVGAVAGFDACRNADGVHYKACGSRERRAFTEDLAPA